MPAERDLRRWIRHNRDLQGFSAIFPSGGQDPGSPRLMAPWLSDTVQITSPATPVIRSNVPPTPAAQTNFGVTVPQGETWKLLSWHALFGTDANAANRLFIIQLTNATGSVLWTGEGTLFQVASQFRRYSVSAVGAYGGQQDFGYQVLTYPDFWMPPGYVLRTAILNFQVGDQLSELAYYYELWPG